MFAIVNELLIQKDSRFARTIVKYRQVRDETKSPWRGACHAGSCLRYIELVNNFLRATHLATAFLFRRTLAGI